MFQSDTIIYDIHKIARYQEDSHYDYLAQLDMPDYSWFDFISQWFNRLINSIFSGKIGENVTTTILIFIFFMILASIVFFLYKKRPELFMRSGKKTAGCLYRKRRKNRKRFLWGLLLFSAGKDCGKAGNAKRGSRFSTERPAGTASPCRKAFCRNYAGADGGRGMSCPCPAWKGTNG